MADSMTLALEHKINNPLESHQKVADLYRVSKSSLYDRHTGVHWSHTALAPRHLSIVQEEELVKKINEYARRGTLLTPRHVVELAEAVYDGKLGVNWGSRWRTLEGQRRNDLRVRGRCGLHATDYGLKVYCLNDRDARSTLSTKPASTSVANHILNRCLSWLDKVSENATKKAPATHSGMFKAVVMSTGGIVSRETADEMRRWRKKMGPAAFEGMTRKINLELVRARARIFAM
ncbi:hypothetical protein J008_04728 [Cryptococcus neoformans]|nr:hypothetical protein J008_04728 [Cryptococcus neoformans var. grubii]